MTIAFDYRGVCYLIGEISQEGKGAVPNCCAEEGEERKRGDIHLGEACRDGN